MKNLGNYSVLELNANEIRKTDGGSQPPHLDGTIYFTMSVIHAVGDFLSGGIDRFNKYRN